MEILGMDFIDEEIHKFSYYFCVKLATSATAAAAWAGCAVSVSRVAKCNVGKEKRRENDSCIPILNTRRRK